MARPVRSLLTKELRESIWKMVLAVGLLGVTGAMLGPVYDWLVGMFPLLDSSTLPGWIRDTIDLQVGNYRYYLWGNWYGKNLLQMLAILAGVYGAGLFAAETARGSAGFLFSKPVSRSLVLRVKLAVALGVLWGAALLGTILTMMGSRLAGHTIDTAWFARGVPAALAGSAVVLCLATLLSVLTGDTAKAIGLTVAALAASLLAGAVPALRGYSLFYRMAGGATVATGTVEWLAVGSMLAAAVLLLGIAQAAINRRDI